LSRLNLHPWSALRCAASLQHPAICRRFALEVRGADETRWRDDMALINVIFEWSLLPRNCRRRKSLGIVMAAKRAVKRARTTRKSMLMCEIPNNVILDRWFAHKYWWFRLALTFNTQLTLESVDRILKSWRFDLPWAAMRGLKQMIKTGVEGRTRNNNIQVICGLALRLCLKVCGVFWYKLHWISISLTATER